MHDFLRDMGRRVIALRKSLIARNVSLPHTPVPSGEALSTVHRCCQCFEDVARYLIARRSAPTICIDSEDAVQDVLYLVLKPSIPDLEWENPMPKEANRSWRPDFTSMAHSIAIDAKYVRDKSHGKQITRELDEDIAAARESAIWHHLFFFIYDPSWYIPAVAPLVKHCDGRHHHEGNAVEVHTIVVPSSAHRRHQAR